MGKQTRLIVFVLTALALLACDGGEPAASSTPATSTTVAPGTSTSVATSTTEVASSTTASEATTTTTLVASTTIELPPFPPERTELTHGGDAWAVVLAASEDSDDPALASAGATASAAGFHTGVTDCDFGAATALGLSEEDGHYYTVSVYFLDEADAHAALEAFQARGVEDAAVGVVQTYCLD